MTITLPDELDGYLIRIASMFSESPNELVEALVREEIERVLGIDTDPVTEEDMERVLKAMESMPMPLTAMTPLKPRVKPGKRKR